MEHRYIKDFAIALIFIIALVLAIRIYAFHMQIAKISDKSVYAEESVSQDLLDRIKKIENSIEDRNMFAFIVTRDPLREGNIIKDKADRMKEYEDMVKNTFRLASVTNEYAIFEYQGKSHIAKVGDVIEGRRILSIDVVNDQVTYSVGGNIVIATRSAIPPVPKDDVQGPISGNY
ncbi:MAG: hypothetical protein PHI68_07180 [Candidatus Cloacimonetes bacterium]|nr:hypothetical protein [Candidatus Cloacimonadota bacterium]